MQAMGGRPNVFPYLLLLPALFITLAIVAWPLLETVRLSFTDASLKLTEDFIASPTMRNFSRRFPEVIGRTFYWMAISVTLKMVVGVLGAMLLNSAVPGRAFFRVLVMPPWIVPIAIGVFMWRWMYNGQFGMISGVAQHLGILAGPYEFLGDRTGAFYSTVVTDVWVGYAHGDHLFARCYAVDFSRLARSRLGGWRKPHVSVPAHHIAFDYAGRGHNGLLSAIWTFNSFDIIWILTEGGPRGSTTTMIIDTYKTAISRNRYGEGAARGDDRDLLIVLRSILLLHAVTHGKTELGQ